MKVNNFLRESGLTGFLLYLLHVTHISKKIRTQVLVRLCIHTHHIAPISINLLLINTKKGTEVEYTACLELGQIIVIDK